METNYNFMVYLDSDKDQNFGSDQIKVCWHDYENWLHLNEEFSVEKFIFSKENKFFIYDEMLPSNDLKATALFLYTRFSKERFNNQGSYFYQKKLEKRIEDLEKQMSASYKLFADHINFTMDLYQKDRKKRK